MLIKFLEALFIIGTVGLVLSHPNEFASVVTETGKTYAATVKGLQGI
jgi:hypothetical protein